MQFVKLSDEGSDRATAYNMSAKIVRRDEALYVGWLDAPAEKGEPAKIRVGVCDPTSGALQKTLTLGEGIDNHCGPALLEDGDGRMHIVVGHHHGPFLYRWSDNPSEASSWSEPEPLGPLDTYPALTVDAEGTLHMAHRERGDRWQLWYRRKKKGAAWEAPAPIAISPTPGYNHFMQSLTVGPTGNLHLTFQFHFAETGNAADCKGRAAVYVSSEDGGTTWLDQAGTPLNDLPITLESMNPICHYPDAPLRHSVRTANHVVDGDDRVWMYCSLADAPYGAMLIRDGKGWDRRDMRGELDALNTAGGKSTSLSRTPDGHMHLLVAASPEKVETSWFDPSHEIFHLELDGDGKRVGLRQLTETDPENAHWLPALERWEWTRVGRCCTDRPWFTYTRGLNSGGIGGDNKSARKTEVYLGKL